MANDKVIKQIFRVNNFDLLRLFAALQVAFNHSLSEFHVQVSGILKELVYFSYIFPGVPIFFFISGFLISKSYESNNRLVEYFQNRILRLYPGLFVCVSLSFILIYLSGYMASTNAGFIDWSILYFAKTTILQFYNPDFMRAYGDGVLNGSLWTITVEIQFYFLVPIVYALFKLHTSGKANISLIVLILFFLLVNRLYVNIPGEYHHSIPYKLLRVSFLPWFYMFLVGVFVQKNFNFFYKLLAGKFILFFTLYCIVGFSALKYRFALGNDINPIVFIFLVAAVFSFSYSFVGLSKTLLRGNDISYGAYIYHMPIINFMVFIGLTGALSLSISALFATLFIATLSWFMIEKRSLRFKRHPLNPLNKQ